MSRSFRLAAVAVALSACSQATSTQGSGTSHNIITREEIRASESQTAYDAVQKLRGNFFSDRGKTTILGKTSNLPVVYLDGMRYGELQSLRNIQANSVSSIQLYRAWEAQQKYGNGALGGVIAVTTRTN